MKKGFTLIELLAVIVLLAIVALIAVPIINDIINESKKSSRERSLEFYKEAIENSVIDYILDSNGKRPIWDDISDKIRNYYDGPEITCSVIFLNFDGSVYLRDCKVGKTIVNKILGESKVYGDVNGDGIINTKDRTEIGNCVINQVCSNNANMDAKGDINDDDARLLYDLLNATFGDVNSNGIIDQNDYDVLKSYLSNNTSVSIDTEKSDMNKDGKIDILDIIILDRKLAGLKN